MSDSPKLSVTVIPDGPLKVSNASSVRYCGQALEVAGDLYLCRCGDSSKAPFCDGTHGKVGFSGACEDDSAEQLRVWEGRTLRTHFNKKACMHVFYCKPLNDLRVAELEGDDAAATEIIRVVESCPSGALTWEAKAQLTEPERAAPGCVVDIVEGGEVRLQAAFDINVPLQARQPADHATLCRCGLSRNKPWCDGRHRKKADFR